MEGEKMENRKAKKKKSNENRNLPTNLSIIVLKTPD